MRWSLHRPAAVLAVVAACDQGGTLVVTDPASCAASAPYPPPPYGIVRGATLADASWPARLVSGADGQWALHELLDACPGEPPLAMIRVVAGWCGTCAWHASHSAGLLPGDLAPLVTTVDVLLRDVDNAPATPEAAAAWQASQDVATDVVIDAGGSILALLPPRTSLPYVLLVDRHTMTLVDAFAPSDVDTLSERVRAALGAPPGPPPRLVDGRFHRDQWDLLVGMSLHEPPPRDTTNAFADDLGVSALGGALFADVTLSPSGTVSCAGCHSAGRQLTDPFPTSPEGVGRVDRNAPSLDLAAYQRWQFWDGRADTLWAQATMPMEAPNEYGSSRLFVDHVIFDFYRAQYEGVFRVALPPLDDTARFPPAGMPGTASWTAMSPADQQAATAVFVNAGKAIEAYERTFRGLPIPLEGYLAGDPAALTDAQKDGLLLYMTSGCPQCHWGPRLTDDAFHVLRFPTGRSDFAPDPGRLAGIPELAASALGVGSAFSDDPGRARPSPMAGPWTLGAFKTPGLRSVALTAPYGHGGNYINLKDVVALHRAGGMPPGSRFTEGTTEPWLPQFDAANDDAIVAFLATLAMGFAH